MSIENVADDAHSHMRQDFQRDIRLTADRLRTMAEAVGRIAEELDNPDAPGPYASYVARVQHEVLWGVANLSIDRLTREASNVELARTMSKRKSEEAALGRTDHPFTARELEVARLVTHGASDSAIAQRLFISPRTVQVHLQNVYTKIRVNNRTELSAYMHRNALTEEPS